MTFCATLATFPLPTPKYRAIRGIKGGIKIGKNDGKDSFSFSHTNLVITGGIKSGIKMRKKERCKCLAFIPSWSWYQKRYQNAQKMMMKQCNNDFSGMAN